MNNTNIAQVKLNEAKKYIKNNIKEQLDCLKSDKQCSVIFISGAPGIGKSDILEDIALELNMGLNPQYLGTMLVEQFGMPLPTLDKDIKFQKWSEPDFYQTNNLRVDAADDGPIILFMDDIHLATKTIQTYFFQLLTYRSIHNKRMPDNFVMVAAGNRSTDKAGAQPIMAPIVNRFYLLDVVAEADDWLNNFAIQNKIRQDIISFIEFYPHLLQSEPLESKAWASPRSWTYFSQELDQMEKNEGILDISDIIRIGQGHIGTEYVTKFTEYVQLYMKWDTNKFFDRSWYPDLTKLSKIETYSLMSAVIAAFLKDLRLVDFDLTKQGIDTKLQVIEKFFKDLISTCIEIIPLGLRSLVVSENSKMTSRQATLFYKLTQNNPTLLNAMKDILSMK